MYAEFNVGSASLYLDAGCVKVLVIGMLVGSSYVLAYPSRCLCAATN